MNFLSGEIVSALISDQAASCVGQVKVAGGNREMGLVVVTNRIGR